MYWLYTLQIVDYFFTMARNRYITTLDQRDAHYKCTPFTHCNGRRPYLVATLHEQITMAGVTTTINVTSKRPMRPLERLGDLQISADPGYVTVGLMHTGVRWLAGGFTKHTSHKNR